MPQARDGVHLIEEQTANGTCVIESVGLGTTDDLRHHL